jgi:heme exporter protein CcmB
MNNLFLLIKKDLSLALWQKGYFFNLLAVYLTILILTPLVTMLDHSSVNIILPLIFTSTVSGIYLFKGDYKNFSLQQIILSGLSPMILVLSKIITIFLLLILCCIFGILINYLFFDITFENFKVISITISLICFMLALLTTFSASITIKLAQSEMFNLILIFPISTSFLFYASSIMLSLNTNNITNELLILTGMTLAIFPLIIWACSNSLSKL